GKLAVHTWLIGFRIHIVKERPHQLVGIPGVVTIVVTEGLATTTAPEIHVTEQVFGAEGRIAISGVTIRSSPTAARTTSRTYLETVIEEASHQRSFSRAGEADDGQLVHINERH